MPKDTFLNLNEDKKQKIVEVLKETFSNKTIFDANVKEIVEKLDIARGSFYQYFENLEDSYFMILDLETVDIHKLFLKILKNNAYDVFLSLDEYGKKLSKILFDPETYSIYKNKFLYWTPELEKGWQKYKINQVSILGTNSQTNENTFIMGEEMQFIKAIIHNLIERNYLNSWSSSEFLIHFNKYIEWLKGGINFDGIN
ncbi:AcrR family transcriptional regulator [Peptoniphilus olsenii]|uniref:AcrR family transcriptional regulator n=1 Tax=Peptoniphilus olsenii TaxID=411570 RepID=A0ABV2J8Z7_9FIRM